MTTPEQIVLSWSGGKDSALALDALRADPAFEVVALMTTVTRVYDRISIHGVRRALLHAQAESLGLPIIEVTLEPQSSNEAYESAFAAAAGVVRGRFPAVRRLAFGDLFLTDVRAYRERLLEPLDLGAVFPLWGRPTDQLARDFIARGFVARLVCVDTTQLDGAFAGALYDAAFLASLPASVDPCGEKGEFHTFVSAGPGFRWSIEYELGDLVLRDGRFSYCDLIPPDGVFAPTIPASSTNGALSSQRDAVEADVNKV